MPSHRARISVADGLDLGHLLGDDLLDAARSVPASSKYRAILRSDLAVASAPMKFTLNHGMPYFVSIISAM